MFLTLHQFYMPNKSGFVKLILLGFYSHLLQDKDSSRMYLQAASSEQSLVSRFWSNASTWSSFSCPTHFGSSVNPVSTRCSSIIDSASSTTLQPILFTYTRIPLKSDPNEVWHWNKNKDSGIKNSCSYQVYGMFINKRWTKPVKRAISILVVKLKFKTWEN